MPERRRVLLCGTWPDPHILDLLQPIVQCHPDTTRSDWPEYYCHLAHQYCSSKGLVQARLSSRPLGTMFLALGGDHVYFIAISMLTQTEQNVCASVPLQSSAHVVVTDVQGCCPVCPGLLQAQQATPLHLLLICCRRCITCCRWQ